jgi:hypothetical protein
MFYLAILALVIAVIVADARRVEREQTEPTLPPRLQAAIAGNIPPGSAVHHALSEAIARHLADGGDVGDILAWRISRHPAGFVYASLVTSADVVAGAEAIVREGA